MDEQTIDQEYAKLQAEFQAVAKTVQGLAEKMQAAERSGDTNATDWLSDLKLIAQDISDEQTQATALLQAIHGWINELAETPASGLQAKPPLYAVGHEPENQPEPDQQPAYHERGGMLGGLMGGGMRGGPFGGFLGGGFGQAMMMGGEIGLGESLIASIFRM